MNEHKEMCRYCKFIVFGSPNRCHLNPPILVTSRSISSSGPLENRQMKIHPAVFETPVIELDSFCSYFKSFKSTKDLPLEEK